MADRARQRRPPLASRGAEIDRNLQGVRARPPRVVEHLLEFALNRDAMKPNRARRPDLVVDTIAAIEKDAAA